jgi:type IV pilus assembly protein PilW
VNNIINKNFNNKHRQSGFSLIELLVAVTLGLFLMTALVEVLLSGNRSFTSANHLSRLQENGRIATSMIATDLKRAGYMGGNSDVGNILGSEGPETPAVSCLTTDTTWGRMVTEGVFGLDDTNTGYACIPNPNLGPTSYLRGDVLTVRFASPWVLQTVGALPKLLYLRTSMFEGKIFMGSDETTIDNLILDQPQSLHELLSYAYYVGDSGRSCAGAAVPSLFRVRLGPTGQPLTEELLPGVEHFQVQYGVNDGVTGLQYLNANAVTDFSQVTSARIWLLIRAECAETGFTDGRTYTLGGQTYTPDDGFRRQLYSSVIMLRNG